MPDRTPSRPGRPSSGRSRAGGGRPASGPARHRASRPRGSNRPASAARPRTPTPEPPSASTAWVRGTIVLGIVVMLAVTLVPTLRSLVEQRSETAALEARIAQQKQTVAALQREAELWKDPAYIEVQARERLKFVRVGDRAYTVIGADTEKTESETPQPVVAAPMANDSSPWYGKVWQSIQIADRPAAGLPQTK